MHQGILIISRNYKGLVLFPSQRLRNATMTHVRMMQHVLTVRGAISVFVQPVLREKIAPKVNSQNIFPRKSRVFSKQ